MDDKDYYLTFWGYTLGTEAAEQAWKAKQEFTCRQTAMVAPDLPGYASPVTGLWIEGRAARREDLKRSGCRPYEDGERQEHQRQMKDAERKNDAKLFEATARTFYQLPESKRRALQRAK